MRALSIRQPFAELILRGIKTREFRSTRTNLIGERFYIYAAKGPPAGRNRDGAGGGPAIWSDDLTVPRDEALPPWMAELAEELMRVELPRGLLVGTAVISHCTGPVTPPTGQPAVAAHYQWHLADVQRLAEPIRPTRHPQPVWFRPF